jgi:hypothetical protein
MRRFAEDNMGLMLEAHALLAENAVLRAELSERDEGNNSAQPQSAPAQQPAAAPGPHPCMQ